MIAEPNAKIFLAEKRLKLENPFNQNFTTYLPEQIDLSRKTVVGVSSSLSDDILTRGNQLTSRSEGRFMGCVCSLHR
jgi:hypothetical protein